MTPKSDCIVSALQGFLSSNVLSYPCEMCAGDENHCLLLLSTTLQNCQCCVYCLQFSQYSVFKNQCLLPASSNVLLFCSLFISPWTWQGIWHLLWGVRTAWLRDIVFIYIHGTHAHCGCLEYIRNTVSGLDKHLFVNSFKKRLAECLPCLLK